MAEPTPSSGRRGRPTILGTAMAVAVVMMSACSVDGREMRLPSVDQDDSVISIPDPTEAPVGFDTAVLDDGAPAEFSVVGPWVDGSPIPDDFTCAGENKAPVISWTAAPETTASIAVVLIDTTSAAADSVGVVHYAVYNIDPADGASFDLGRLPMGAIAGATDIAAADSTATGWNGPCPPLGQTHTYVLEVHALDQMLESLDGATAADVVQAIDAATIATASISASATGLSAP